jgi:hypothetical protein
MTLPDHAATKYSVYTLACHSIQKRLRELRNSCTLPEQETYIKRFDEALGAFLKDPFADLTSVKAAAGSFNDRLGIERDGIKAQNSAAGAVFDQIIEAVDNAASTWNYEKDVAALGRIGRNLAQCFYYTSPHKKTQDALEKEANVDVKGIPGPLMSYQPSTNTIIVRFSINHRFEDYLLYASAFMHEYTAHIFGVDLENTLFNDGWMMFAVEKFLVKCSQQWDKASCYWNPHGKMCCKDNLDKRQIWCWPRRFPHNFQDESFSSSGFSIAQNFFYSITPELVPCFWELTRQLAAFSPEPGEDDRTVKTFIDCLNAELSRSTAVLHDKLKRTCDFRSLLRIMHL